MGTASPASKLDVSGGGARVQGLTNPASGSGIEFGYDTTQGVIQSFSNRATSTQAPLLLDNASYKVRVGGADKIVIDSSGNLLVGTTAQGGGALITARSGTNRMAAFFDVNIASSSATPAITLQKFTNDSTTAQVLMQFVMNNGSNGAGQINGNGANAAAFGTYSDLRLKENITTLPSQLANICLLKPSEFDYKDGSGHQIGFIAQEMQEVYPDSVGVGNDGMLTITAWSKTEARLVKAIQELKAKNDSLEARLEALEAK